MITELEKQIKAERSIRYTLNTLIRIIKKLNKNKLISPLETQQLLELHSIIQQRHHTNQIEIVRKNNE